MSAEVSVKIPSLIELYEKLLGKKAEEVMIKELNKIGIFIIDKKDIVVQEGEWEDDDEMGYEVKTNKGTFYPVLTESDVWNGNYFLYIYILGIKKEIKNQKLKIMMCSKNGV